MVSWSKNFGWPARSNSHQVSFLWWCGKTRVRCSVWIPGGNQGDESIGNDSGSIPRINSHDAPDSGYQPSASRFLAFVDSGLMQHHAQRTRRCPPKTGEYQRNLPPQRRLASVSFSFSFPSTHVRSIHRQRGLLYRLDPASSSHYPHRCNARQEFLHPDPWSFSPRSRVYSALVFELLVNRALWWRGWPKKLD